MFVVCATFKIKPAETTNFMPLMKANAQASLSDEPQCQQFDICVNALDANTVFLYEVYDDESAFKDHLKSSHFLEFDQAVSSMIASRSVQIFTRI